MKANRHDTAGQESAKISMTETSPEAAGGPDQFLRLAQVSQSDQEARFCATITAEAALEVLGHTRPFHELPLGRSQFFQQDRRLLRRCLCMSESIEKPAPNAKNED